MTLSPSLSHSLCSLRRFAALYSSQAQAQDAPSKAPAFKAAIPNVPGKSMRRRGGRLSAWRQVAEPPPRRVGLHLRPV